MLRRMKKAGSALLALLIVLSLSASAAYADSCAYWSESGRIYFVYGGSTYIPEGFSTINIDHVCDYAGFYYDYYDCAQDMQISLSESSVDVYPVAAGDLVDVMYSSYKRELPKAVYDAKEKDWFELSGYDGNYIYYIRCKMANQAFYTVWFCYPTRNRRVCDRIVEQVCADFSTDWPYYAGGKLGISPSPADLDAIRSDAKYPNYSWMYLDHYEYATMNRDAYCFKDPDTDIWRQGNFFTVRKGTQVIILAKSDGYGCVILDGTNLSGWINLNYMNIYAYDWR